MNEWVSAFPPSLDKSVLSSNPNGTQMVSILSLNFFWCDSWLERSKRKEGTKEANKCRVTREKEKKVKSFVGYEIVREKGRKRKRSIIDVAPEQNQSAVKEGKKWVSHLFEAIGSLIHNSIFQMAYNCQFHTTISKAKIKLLF